MSAGKMVRGNVYTITWFHTPSIHQSNPMYPGRAIHYWTKLEPGSDIFMSSAKWELDFWGWKDGLPHLLLKIYSKKWVEGKRLLRSCSLYRLQAEQELHKMSNQNVFYNAAKLGNDLQSLCSLINYHQARTAESVKLDFHIYILTCISFPNCQLIPSCNSLPWWHF